MTEPACQSCGEKPKRVGAWCDVCARAARESLRYLADHYEDLQDAVTERVRSHDGGGSPDPGSPIPFDVEAHEVAEDVRSLACRIATRRVRRFVTDRSVSRSRHRVREYRRAVPAHVGKLAAVGMVVGVHQNAGRDLRGAGQALAWIADYAGDIAHAPGMDDLPCEASEIVDRVQKVIDRPVPRRVIGPCGDCGTMITTPHEHPRSATCGGCGGTYTGAGIDALRDYWTKEVQQRRATPAEAARYASVLSGEPVSVKTIRSWIARGKIPKDDDGTVLVGDVYYQVRT